jgi:hypothetical protein
MNTEIHKLITINRSSLHDKCQKNKSKYDRASSVVAGPGAPSFSLPPLAMQPSCGSSPPSACCLSAHRRLLSCTRSANIQISVSTCDTMEKNDGSRYVRCTCATKRSWGRGGLVKSATSGASGRRSTPSNLARISLHHPGGEGGQQPPWAPLSTVARRGGPHPPKSMSSPPGEMKAARLEAPPVQERADQLVIEPKRDLESASWPLIVLVIVTNTICGI